MTYGDHFKNVPQSQPIPGKNMIQNAAGGYVYEIDDWKRLRRFLILGCEGGTYYEGERKLTVENAETLRRCLAADWKRAIDLIVEVSDKALGPKNDPCVFALAFASIYESESARSYAYKAIPKVCRIGTHIFQFAQFRKDLGGGWSYGYRNAIGRWYLNRPTNSLVTQALKYQQRNGVSHADLLRLAHPVPKNHDQKLVLSAIVRPEGGVEYAPTPGAKAGEITPVRSVGGGWKVLESYPLVEGYLKIKTAVNASEAATIIRDHELVRELVPTEFLTDPKVWDALLPHMGIGALTRNLGNLSKCGLLVPLSETEKAICARFEDQEDIHASRLHPWAILVAAKVYARGRGVKGSGAWTPSQKTILALDKAFELAFANVEPTNKRFMLAIDCSGSMGWNSADIMLACESAAAMALITARTEPNHYITAFDTGIKDLGITAKDTLPTVLAKTAATYGGGTNTSAAIQWAQSKKIPVDVFEILTDNETWAGDTHSCNALKEYRKAMGIPAKLAVVGFTATARSIGDQQDPGMMDFVGMDASLPQALAAFVNE